MNLELLKAELEKAEYQGKSDAEKLALTNASDLFVTWRTVHRDDVAAYVASHRIWDALDYVSRNVPDIPATQYIVKPTRKALFGLQTMGAFDLSNDEFAGIAHFIGIAGMTQEDADGFFALGRTQEIVTQEHLNIIAQSDLANSLEGLRNTLDGMLSQRRNGVAVDVMSVLASYSE